MNKWIFMSLFLLFFGVFPVVLALAQNVPTQSGFQFAVLLASVGAFGLMLGLFWLSRLMPRGTVNMKFSSTLRWHKYIGYTAGAFFMVHPVLMIARRFWVQESNPFDNLMLMLRSPLLLPAIVAWVLLMLIVTLAFFRKRFSAKLFRTIHGVLSVGFVGLATRHVVAVGRHSNPAMSAFWVTLAGVAVAALLFSYLTPLARATKGTVNESA